MNIPFKRPKSFGFRMAGQKNRRNKNPDTLLYVTDRRKSPYRSSAQALMCLKIYLNSGGHLAAEPAIDCHILLVRMIRLRQFRSRSSCLLTRFGSISQSGSLSSMSRMLEPIVSSRYSLPRRRMCMSSDFVSREFPRNNRFASTVAERPRSRTRTSRS